MANGVHGKQTTDTYSIIPRNMRPGKLISHRLRDGHDLGIYTRDHLRELGQAV